MRGRDFGDRGWLVARPVPGWALLLAALACGGPEDAPLEAFLQTRQALHLYLDEALALAPVGAHLDDRALPRAMATQAHVRNVGRAGRWSTCVARRIELALGADFLGESSGGGTAPPAEAARWLLDHYLAGLEQLGLRRTEMQVTAREEGASAYATWHTEHGRLTVTMSVAVGPDRHATVFCFVHEHFE